MKATDPENLRRAQKLGSEVGLQTAWHRPTCSKIRSQHPPSHGTQEAACGTSSPGACDPVAHRPLDPDLQWSFQPLWRQG